jgi:tetratricopeptide (TPR) repeat protein
MAKYLSEIFLNPDMIDGTPPALWKERAEALKVEQKSMKDALPVYKSITKDYPEDADSHYDLSRAYFELGELDACKDELAAAVRLDSGYSGAYLDYATQLFSKGDKAKAESFASLLK